jgi:hypothetical protein
VRIDLEPDQHALGVRQGADDLADRLGEPADQRRDGDDLIGAGEGRLLEQVDHFDGVPSGEVLLADPLEVRQGGDRLGRLARHVEPQRDDLVEAE